MFFTSGGSEAVEAALKLARQYHKLRGTRNKTKVIARETAYHGATLGASARPASRRCARRSSPSRPAAATYPTRTSTACPGYGVENLAESIAQRIEFEGPETVSAVIFEPVQNAGGCFTPPEGYFQRVREICASTACC